MEKILIWRRMAEKWREAADDVAEPALRSCYVERAARYERLAALAPLCGGSDGNVEQGGMCHVQR